MCCSRDRARLQQWSTVSKEGTQEGQSPLLVAYEWIFECEKVGMCLPLTSYAVHADPCPPERLHGERQSPRLSTYTLPEGIKSTPVDARAKLLTGLHFSSDRIPIASVSGAYARVHRS